jgi:hypothetical protein
VFGIAEYIRSVQCVPARRGEEALFSIMGDGGEEIYRQTDKHRRGIGTRRKGLYRRMNKNGRVPYFFDAVLLSSSTPYHPPPKLYQHLPSFHTNFLVFLLSV